MFISAAASVMSLEMSSYMFNLCNEAFVGTNGIGSDVTIEPSAKKIVVWDR